jgi:hypothetical protein
MTAIKAREVLRLRRIKKRAGLRFDRRLAEGNTVLAAEAANLYVDIAQRARRMDLIRAGARPYEEV